MGDLPSSQAEIRDEYSCDRRLRHVEALGFRREVRFVLVLVLVLVLIKDPLTIKRMVTLRHPYTRASILCQ